MSNKAPSTLDLTLSTEAEMLYRSIQQWMLKSKSGGGALAGPYPIRKHEVAPAREMKSLGLLTMTENFRKNGKPNGMYPYIVDWK